MPKKYENKSNHNKDFLNSLITDYPSDYYDWKVTVQFYTCLHRANKKSILMKKATYWWLNSCRYLIQS